MTLITEMPVTYFKDYWKARDIADELESTDEDGWTYTVIDGTTEGEFCIAVKDESLRLLGYL